MKILLINYDYYPLMGGSATLTKNHAETLEKQGHDVEVVTANFKKQPKISKRDNITIYRVPAIRRKQETCSWWELITFTLSAMIFLFKHCYKNKPDIIQIFFDFFPSGLLGFILKKCYSIPYAIYLGGIEIPGSSPFYKRLYPMIKYPLILFWRNANLIISCSMRYKKLAKDLTPELPIYYIPNSADTHFYQPKEKQPTRTCELIAVGRFDERKSLQHILQALPKVIAEANCPIQLTLVGEGPLRPEFEKFVTEYNLENQVNFPGILNRTELRNAYQNADIFIIPSLAEGMSCSLLEAMACALPIVGSRISGNEDLIRSDYNGILYSHSDIPELANALLQLINNPSIRQTYSHNSLLIAKQHDTAIITKQYVDLYFDSIDRTQTTKGRL